MVIDFNYFVSTGRTSQLIFRDQKWDFRGKTEMVTTQLTEFFSPVQVPDTERHVSSISPIYADLHTNVCLPVWSK